MSPEWTLPHQAVKRDDLLAALEQALAREAASRAERDELAEWRARYDTLTSREREVFALVVAGMLNKQIAGEIGAAERTVKAHRAQVMAKMGVGSLADLVRVASRLSLPTPGSSPPCAARPRREDSDSGPGTPRGSPPTLARPSRGVRRNRARSDSVTFTFPCASTLGTECRSQGHLSSFVEFAAVRSSVEQPCREPHRDSVADVVQHSLDERKALSINRLSDRLGISTRKLLILLALGSWLAALDDFRNWLIREAA